MVLSNPVRGEPLAVSDSLWASRQVSFGDNGNLVRNRDSSYSVLTVHTFFIGVSACGRVRQRDSGTMGRSFKSFAILLAFTSTFVFAAGGQPGSWQFPIQIVYGETIKGELAEGDDTQAGRYVDHYKFNAKAGEEVTVTMDAGSLPFFSSVRKKWVSGSLMKNNYQDGKYIVTYSFTVKKDDEYYLMVMAKDRKQSGAYTLTVTEKNTAAKPATPDLAAVPASNLDEAATVQP